MTMDQFIIIAVALLLVAVISFGVGAWYNSDSHKEAQLRALRDAVAELERRIKKRK